MPHKIVVLFCFISVFSHTYGESQVGRTYQDPIEVSPVPTDLLPPSAAKEYESRDQENHADLHIQVRELEKRIERLETLIEILRSSSNMNTTVTTSDLKEEPSDPSIGKDPIADFEKIKQMAISKDPNIETVTRKFKEIYKDHLLVAKAHFFLADYYYSQKSYEKAINLIKEGLSKYKDSPEEPRAYWILSLILTDMDRKNEACTTLKKMLSLPQKSVSTDLRENATKQFQLLNCQ